MLELLELTGVLLLYVLMLAFMPGITGVENAPGECRFKTVDLIGVTQQGVPEDDGDFLLFLHELNESSGEYAILFGDLNLDLDLARS